MPTHYIIDHGKIQWARNFTRDEIQLNLERDDHLLDNVQFIPRASVASPTSTSD
ncbi:hypothetical protein AB0L63_03775 [Nocardia sp. NPDC051990]|uniref:hypothetical protein n=1 Tax=Nocardia sp. NPDC051990 TaxID=3155285 RepID=UPI00341AEDA6